MIRPHPTLAADPILLRLTDPRRTGTRPSPLPIRLPQSLRRTLFLKQIFDYFVATSLLALTTPLIFACALLVRLTSRGPAFYSQQRVGQFGRVFTIFKLRTMFHQCERNTGPTWSVPGDPRVTPVGRVLRALHVDELPQLVNVLRGQMSLIGPRPERPEIAAALARSIPDYNARSAVLPGITGHAQVHLPPDTSVADVRDKVRLDRYYLNRLSIGFDLLTLMRTALKVFGMYRTR
ncbi:MAG TPA: sugar transferase [Gemmataceae bacterium]|jgi:lipopolysaccharide/colanic/teichoic acid biosynthesis glycosyltransferase|nr:sugar transferase [Gemmataceae bacterium]